MKGGDKRAGWLGKEEKYSHFADSADTLTETFARLIGHPAPTEAEIQILDPVEWDSTGQYTEIVDAVREAGEGSDVRVYRVVKDHVRVYYWVVTVAKGKRLVGVKALSVES